MIKTFTLLFAGVVAFVAFYVGQSHRPLSPVESLRHSSAPQTQKPSPVSPHPKIKLRPKQQIKTLNPILTLNTNKLKQLDLPHSKTYSQEGYIESYDVRDLISKDSTNERPIISMGISGDPTISIVEPEDILPPTGDEFADLIKEIIGEEYWEDHEAEYRNGCLIVFNEHHVHREISYILASMRLQKSDTENLNR